MCGYHGRKKCYFAGLNQIASAGKLSNGSKFDGVFWEC